MDNTGGPGTARTSSSEHVSRSVSDRPARRFGIVSALVRFALALAVVVTAGLLAYNWVMNRPEAPQRMNRERTFTVNAVAATAGTHRADVATYGQVVAARTLDLRTQVQGQVIEVSPNFAAGATVSAGEVLVRIDPFAYDAAVLEAREAKLLEEQNIATARAALASAETDLERARSLLSSGAATQQTVDTRVLTVAERQQALNQREANLFTLEAQIQRQQAAIAQAEHQLDVAQRNRANTEIIAPFDATITSADISQGGHVNANETIGSLYETDALDVTFMLSDHQFGQLNAAGIAGRPVRVIWPVEPRPVEANGVITRTAGQVDPATGGITLFARLDADEAVLLRPGTFVSVIVEGISHENSLLLPETAVYNEDHVYVAREGRMAAVPVSILARQNDKLIVSGTFAPDERIITTRLSQAGEGVAITIEGDEPQPGPGGPGGMRGPGGG